MQGTPLLTVVTATRNAVETLSDTLLSVRGLAKVIPLEHWVVDGASKDGTVELLKSRLYPELRWISEPDGGLYEAINKGIRRATGEWIAILNADDFYLPEYAEDLLFLLKEANREKWDYLFGPARFQCLAGKPDRRLEPVAAEKRLTSISAPFVHPATILRRDLYQQLGPYREDMVVAADTEKMFQLLESRALGKEYFFPLLVMREGGISYRSYETATLELLEIHKRRQSMAGWKTLWKYYRGERLRSHPVTPSGSWFQYWRWVASDLFGLER